jgi:hypothetical protein
MKWPDFGPYVLPYVFGCPEPTMEQHVRLAAIEFFRRTLSWRVTLDASVTDGASHEVVLDTPSQSQVIKIKSVSLDGRDLPLVETQHGLDLSRTDSMGDYAFTLDGRTLLVYPLQAAGAEVRADVALAPSIASTSIPDAPVLPHVQAIAHGAIASIKRLPSVELQDPQGAMMQQALFEARITAVAAKHGRGALAAKMRSRATFL